MSIFQSLSIRKIRKPRLNFLCLHMFLLALPFGIEYAPGDSSETNIHVSFGHGNYASILQGCEDNEPLDKDQLTYWAIGLQVDRIIIPHLRLGIRGSFLYDEEIYDSYIYDEKIGAGRIRSTQVTVINPFVNLEWRYLAFGGGYVYASHGVGPTAPSRYDLRPAGTDRERPLDFSLFARLGDVNRLYFSTALYSSVPLYSRGYFQLGIGGATRNGFSWWGGMGVGPYDGAIGIGEIGFDINQNLTVNASAGFGQVEGINQNSFSIGLKLRIPK